MAGCSDLPISIQVIVLWDAKLILVRRIELRMDMTTAGTHPDADIVLPQGTAAMPRRHFSIWRRNNQFVLDDLHTRWGTYHNGREVVGPAVLKDGDVVSIVLDRDLVGRSYWRLGDGMGEPLPVTDQDQAVLRLIERQYLKHGLWQFHESLEGADAHLQATTTDGEPTTIIFRQLSGGWHPLKFNEASLRRPSPLELAKIARRGSIRIDDWVLILEHHELSPPDLSYLVARQIEVLRR